MLKDKKEIKVFVYKSFSKLEAGVKEGKYQQYKVPFEEQMTILDVLNYVYESFGRNLSYYYSCRIGKCHGCIVSVNGKNKRACTTLAKDGLKIGPAIGFKLIKDLFVDFSKKC